jgi:hypothetical protein
MSGIIEYKDHHGHQCEPGVVLVRGSKRFERMKVQGHVNPGDHWICDDCNSIWEYMASGWERTMLVRTTW